jgi:hypothetical protein
MLQPSTPFPSRPPSQAGLPWDVVLREIQRAWSEAYQEERPGSDPTPKPVPPRPRGC